MGMFEDQVARIDAIENAVRQLLNVSQAQVGGIAQAVSQQAQPSVGGNAFGIGAPAAQPQAQPATGNAFGIGGTPASQPAATQVTPEMIQQLITPLVAREDVKAELTRQMQAMGIQGLGDARPDQLAELHARFTAVRDHFAGSAPAAAQTTAAPSII